MHLWLHCRPAIPEYGFQLLGFDYMLDHELKPWLMEVNSAPSIMAEVCVDVGVVSFFTCQT